MLLELLDPAKVIGRCREYLEPRESMNWRTGSNASSERHDRREVRRGSFALPDSPVKIYYGAADTVVASQRHHPDLLDAALEGIFVTRNIREITMSTNSGDTASACAGAAISSLPHGRAGHAGRTCTGRRASDTLIVREASASRFRVGQ